jgi:hypothetical protein
MTYVAGSERRRGSVASAAELSRRPLARIAALSLALACAFAILPAWPAGAQVQATKQNTLQWIRGVCQQSLTDIGRAAIVENGKTVAEVCNCTADNMWKKFPSTYYWVQETNPYEWNKVKAEFPKVLTACIFK